MGGGGGKHGGERTLVGGVLSRTLPPVSCTGFSAQLSPLLALGYDGWMGEVSGWEQVQKGSSARRRSEEVDRATD